MSELSFKGRVAVVTGAGRGIGRAHACLLAERGAQVVVNDLDGIGSAQSVVGEIAAAGGEAVADANDVSTQDGGQAVIDNALDHFGRIDIVVNNAGIVSGGGLPEVDVANLERQLDVHLIGSFTTMWAAWPHFLEQGYGRVVLTTSTGMFGVDNNLSYAAAKAGVVGLARSAKVAGEPHGIKVNLIAPATRMAGTEEDAVMPADAVAPMVAYLAHESCPVSGEIYTAGAGRFARLFIASTEGYAHRDGPATIEDVAENWTTINDETGYYVPADLTAWSGRFLNHLFANQASG